MVDFKGEVLARFCVWKWVSCSELSAADGDKCNPYQIETINL